MSKKMYSIYDIGNELSMNFNDIRVYATVFNEFLDIEFDYDLLGGITLPDKHRLVYLIKDFVKSGKEIREYIEEVKSDEQKCALLRALSECAEPEERLDIDVFFEKVMNYLSSIDSHLDEFEGLIKEVGRMIVDTY